MSRSRSGTIRKALGPVRARLLRHLKTANDQFVNITLSRELDECQNQHDDIHELVDKLRSCISVITEKDTQWQNIITGLGEEEIEDEEKLYTDTAIDGYLVELEDARDIVSRLDRKLLEANRVIVSGSGRRASGERKSALQTTGAAKLPKLALPFFSGDCFEWMTFWNIFKTSVHEKELAASEKFAYLRGQLSGAALKSIDGLHISDSNYDIALGILRERYERTDSQLVGTLYSQLKRLRTSSTRVTDLLSTYDNCERIFRQLETCGENTDGNRSLVLELFSKYPGSVVKDLMEHQDVGPHSTLKEVRSAIHKYIKRSENLAEVLADLDPFNDSQRSQRLKSPADNQQSSYRDIEPSKRGATQTSAFAASSKPQNPNNPQNPCYFCGDAHFNSACVKFPTAEQRMKRLHDIGRCSRCLSSVHKEADCRTSGNRLRCFFCKTVGEHMSPLCVKEFGPPKRDAVSNEPQAAKPNLSASSFVNANEQTVLLTASTTVRNPENGDVMTARIIFDSGSHRSYVTTAFADALRLTTMGLEPLRISIFGTKRSLSVTSRRVSMHIEEADGSKREVVAQTTPIITNCTITPCPIPYEDVLHMKAMKCKLADECDAKGGTVDILIGSDYFWEFLSGTRTRSPSGLYFIPSTLGMLIGGKRQLDGTGASCGDAPPEEPSLLCLVETSNEGFIGQNPVACPVVSNCYPAYPDIDEFWSLETIGITDDPVTSDDDRALEQFNTSVRFANGRYYVSWPWKDNKHLLPTNRELAMSRFRSLAKRLRTTNSDVHESYNQVISDQIEKGVIERVPEDQRDGSDNAVHYLSHHPVVKLSSSTTKVRIVYDASAKARKDCPSLNECLYRGPVILPDLCQMLIRFRLKPIGIVADVEKAFLQMCLQDSERDVTRFLWFRDSKVLSVEGNVDEYRFCRVPFGIISSPFLLGATIQFHLRHYDSWVAATIRSNIYVDNVITSVNTVDEANTFYAEAKEIFVAAGMNLQQWCSNSEILTAGVPEHDKTKQFDNKILGMQWDAKDDTLRLKNHTLADATTKRQILQTIASIYDPLDLFQPAILPAKQFLQALWTENTPWDQVLSDDKQREWQVVCEDLKPIFDVRIRRCPFETDSPTTDLVVFCDASARSYATAVYLRVKQRAPGVERWSVHLVYSKSRLAPKKRSGVPVSLPRLELLGCVIGVRAGLFVRNSLPGGGDVEIHVFTDSMCVLHWLRSDKSLSVFVRNRVSEINGLENAEFLYVSTDENPADFSTRGKSATELRKSSLWWSGPPWLRSSRQEWPSSCTAASSSDCEAVSEMINAECRGGPVFHTMVAADDQDVGREMFLLGIDPSKYSSFRRLLRVTAWCLKFLRLQLGESKKNDERMTLRAMAHMSTDDFINSNDLSIAKLVWVFWAQSRGYAVVQSSLRSNKPHSLLNQLGLGFDMDGVMRCYGRLEHADLSTGAMQPILLAKRCSITDLIIREVHERSFHAGVGHTLSQVRREYWVPQGRAVVRRVLNQCALCKKLKGPPFALPRMPPWPRERLMHSKPFQFVGLDYMGPITVRLAGEPKKMWVCLFTCLAIRAIHLEWVSDASAKEFLACVIRFVARRGTPETIISDNAPQFRVTKNAFDKIWHQTLRDDAVLSYAADQCIAWKFTTELAPWQGGFYERLVGIVKMSLKSAIGRKLLAWEEFVTMIAEVEAIVNSRPITYVYGDYKSGFSLRPCDFLTELTVGMPDSTSELNPCGLGEAGRFLIQFWKSRQRRINGFWDVWYSEYLLSLRERGQSKHRHKKGEIEGSPEVDDVVLVKEADAPRGSWKVGRITRLHRSQDGAVRSADVLLPNKHSVRRSVSHLHPLEAECSRHSAAEDDNSNDPVDEFEGFSADEVDNAIRRVHGATIVNESRENIGRSLTSVAMTLCF